MSDERNTSSASGSSLGERGDGRADEHITLGELLAYNKAASVASEWHVIHAGKESGPFPIAEVIQKAVAGEIDAYDLVKQTGGMWTNAGEAPALQETFLRKATTASSSNAVPLPRAKEGATGVTPSENRFWYRLGAALNAFDHRHPTNKTAIGIVAIVAATCLTAYYIWSSHNRFNLMPGPQGVAFEVDRKTGETWLLAGGRKIPQIPQQTEAESRKKEQDLPGFEANKVTGNASLNQGDGTFSGKLYNGSDWTVSRAVIFVSAKEKDGSVRWARDFSVSLAIPPLTTTSFSFTVADEQGIVEAPWYIKKVVGHKE